MNQNFFFKIELSHNTQKYAMPILAACASTFILLFCVNDILAFLNGACLWGEDGNIFLNQAQRFGFDSIWMPYAGYLHFYPRLFALIAVYFGLDVAPYIFTSAWYLAYFFMAVSVSDFFIGHKISWQVTFLILLAIGLQPHTGETYFNITNAHWFIGVALILRVLSDTHCKPSLTNLLIFVLFGLTGPFSIIAVGLIVVKLLIKRDLKKNGFGYLVVLTTAFVQFYLIWLSNRMAGEISTNIHDWTKSLHIFLTFGRRWGVTLVLSILFWTILLRHILDVIRHGAQLSDPLFINGAFILLAGFVFYLAGLWHMKSNPSGMTPLRGGARYFVDPYAFVLISLPLVIKPQKALMTILLVFFIISCIQLPNYKKTISYRSDLNYQSYVWLSAKVKKAVIPIHPQEPAFPGWHIETISKTEKNDSNGILVDLKSLKKSKQNETLVDKLTAKTIHPDYSIPIPEKCQSSKHLGFEVDAAMRKECWAYISWQDEQDNENMTRIYRRYYPKGPVRMQFAFPNRGVAALNFDPGEGIKEGALRDFRLYCD